MIIININRTLGTPIYQQIVEKMRELIDNGDLRPGEKLPSTRELAEKLGVNRSTVYLAYEELWV
ncbi:MAG TPA: GntR family transcriptional regulator, partial [Petrotogaceae bacterium]|nr:GntR family transcriptional regulator [Petrotogaceae bacterium]